MTDVIFPPDDAPEDELVRFYRGLAYLDPDIVSGKALRATGRRWLRDHGYEVRPNPKPRCKRRRR